MKALVTGGAGLIGSHIVDLLLAAGWEVRILDNLEATTHPGSVEPDWVPADAEFFHGDVANLEHVEASVFGCDVVFHQAAFGGFAPDAEVLMTRSNALGTANVVAAAARAGVRKVVVASSQAVYGFTGGDGRPLVETGPTDTPTVYAMSKLYSEQVALRIGDETGLPVVALRYALTYGPRQSLTNPYTGICSIFATRLRNGEPPLIYEDGHQTRDFTFVGDVAAANLFVVDHGRGVFNVGTSRPTQVLDFALMLQGKLGGPEPQILGTGRRGDARHVVCDSSKLQALGWKPEVGLHAGLDRYCDWFLGR